MASIKKRPDGVWRARYRDAGGIEHAKHFDRRVDAQRWLDEAAASIVTGQWVDPRAGKVTFRVYAEAWAESQPWRPSTRRRVGSELKTHLCPALGDRAIATIRPSDLQVLVRRVSEKSAASSVRLIYSTLQSIFKAAELDRVIARSPCVRVALPTVPSKHLVIPTAASLRAIADDLPPYWTAVPYVAAGLGLRPGEIFGLEVGDVDFLRRTVTVARQLNETRCTAPLKTAASARTVPLPDVVGEELARHLAAAGRRDGLVFVGHDGRPVRLNTFTVAWRRSLARLKIEGLRLHDCRHAYASALIAAGESVKTVQSRLGHASAMVTLDTYGHLWPDSEEGTRSAVDAWLAGSADSPRTDAAKAQVSGGSVDYLDKS